MLHNEQIDFVDKDSGEAGFASVRVKGSVIGVALALQTNGDIEVFLDSPEAEQLAGALTRAVKVTGSPSP